MSKDLQILRLEDDLSQAGKELQQLQGVVDNLMSDQKVHSKTIRTMNIENKALKLERDELRDVIQLADDGIADINTHWKQKFFMWRETESHLLRELNESKDTITDMSSEYDAKIGNQILDNNKLKARIETAKSENSELVKSLQNVERELQDSSKKLLEESRKNIHQMFVAREKEVLAEKVNVLEAKVHSFYEESVLRCSREDMGLKQEAERDFNITYQRIESEVANLRSDVQCKHSQIRDLKEEVNRLTCVKETQDTKLRQIRKQYDSSNYTAATSTSALQQERERLKKAGELIDELNAKILNYQKMNKDLKNELDLKFNVLKEKDVQVEHYKTCYMDMETKITSMISEMDNCKHTLDLAESEKLVIKRGLHEMTDKYKAVQGRLDETILDNDKLRDQNALSTSENNATNEAMLHYKNRAIELESEINDLTHELRRVQQDKAIVKEEMETLLDDKCSHKHNLARKTAEYEGVLGRTEKMKEENGKIVAALQSQISDLNNEYDGYKAVMEEKMLNNLIKLTEYSDKCTSNVSLNSDILVDCGTMTETNHCPDPPDIDAYHLHRQVAVLQKELANKDRKLSHAETELAKQASKVVKNQCQIDRLSAKCDTLRTRHVNCDSPSGKSNYQLKQLSEQTETLKNVIHSKDKEIKKLKEAESELKEREQTFWELSELVNILQKELDNKHNNILNEVKFYKSRLMEYERRTPSVNKSINTSPPEQSEDDLSDVEVDVSSCISDENKKVDLQDLANVLNNLKSNYKTDLDALHDSFREKVYGVGSNKECKWIDLMNR